VTTTIVFVRQTGINGNSVADVTRKARTLINQANLTKDVGGSGKNCFETILAKLKRPRKSRSCRSWSMLSDMPFPDEGASDAACDEVTEPSIRSTRQMRVHGESELQDARVRAACARADDHPSEV
jgi:hypothetical protein